MAGALALALALTASGCSTNLSRFDVLLKGLSTKGESGIEVTRAETADQGSGDVAFVVGPSGHKLTRTTVGGAYGRRIGVAAGTGGHVMSAGLHANPRASR
jgi:hypothetical protein